MARPADKNIRELSDKIQAGWTLLAEAHSCNAPLVRNKEGQSYCVKCQEYVEGSQSSTFGKRSNEAGNGTQVSKQSRLTKDTSNDYNIVPSMSQQTSPARAWKEPEMTAEQQEYFRKQDEVSKKIGDKMLEGWTLMAETCPNAQCECPLVREKGSKKMVCCSCGSIVVHEKDYDPSVHGPSAAPVSKPQTEKPKAAAPAPPNEEVEEAASSKASVTRRKHKKSTAECSLPSSQPQTTAYGEVQAILEQKLVDAAAQLRDSKKIGQSTQLAKLVAEVSAALVAVRKL